MPNVCGTDANSLREQMRAGVVRPNDVVAVTYRNGHGSEKVLLFFDGQFLRGIDYANDRVLRRYIASGSPDIFERWERKGTLEEIYGRRMQ